MKTISTISFLLLCAVAVHADPPVNPGGTHNNVHHNTINKFKNTLNKFQANATATANNSNTFSPINRNRNQQAQRQSSSNVNNNTATGGSAKGGNAVSRGGKSSANSEVTVNNNGNQSPTLSPTIPSFTMSVDYLTWKASRKTAAGAPASPYDVKGVKATAAASDPGKAKYDQFLRDQGINPNTVGHSTLTSDGKMIVPTAHQVYSTQAPKRFGF